MVRVALLFFLVPMMNWPAGQEADPLIIGYVVKPSEITIKTDKIEYVAQYHETRDRQDRYKFALTARFENRSGSPLYFHSCSDGTVAHPEYDVVQENEGKVIYSTGYGTVSPCRSSGNTIAVQPGEARTDKLLLYGPNFWTDDELVPKEAQSGQFRLIYRAYLCKNLTTCARQDVKQYSNVFTVRLE
jgi:hypothetical protein